MPPLPSSSSMFRALLELLFTVLIVVIARIVLTRLMRGIANTSRGAFRSTGDSSPPGRPATPPPPTGELHKDPVCGTYVAESTPFRRQLAGQTFYYCSDACREKHALVAR